MRKLIAAFLLIALLAAAVGAALAVPGTQDDPFVTLSYLTGTYYAQAEQAMQKQAQAATSAAETAVFRELDGLAAHYLALADGGDESAGNYAGEFTRLDLSLGDRLELTTGTQVLFEGGQVNLSFAAGSLVDVTDASVVSASGSGMTDGHRYVAAEDTACSLIVHSHAAYLSVQGPYDLERSGETVTPFTDVAYTDWFSPNVIFVYQNNLFQGQTLATTFEPYSNMNRAMLAAVLSRLAGMSSSPFSYGFTDVPDDAWYADAVNWAAWAGIVNGMGDGTYLPEQDLTREQMIIMLYRYARDFAGVEVPAAGDLSVYSDWAAISTGARDAMSWAVSQGVITGYTDGTLRPGGTVTRAEVAAMLQRFSALL